MKKRKLRRPRDIHDLALLTKDGNWFVFVKANLMDADTAESLGNWLRKAAAWLKAQEVEVED